MNNNRSLILQVPLTTIVAMVISVMIFNPKENYCGHGSLLYDPQPQKELLWSW